MLEDSLVAANSVPETGWNSDPATAEEMITTVFPDEAERACVLERLAASIDFVQRIAPGAWAVTLFSYGFRMNVGGVEVLTANSGGIRLLLSGLDARAMSLLSLRLCASPYSSVAGDNAIWSGSVAQFERSRELIAPLHERFMRKAATNKPGRTAPGTPNKGMHPPGLMAYLAGHIPAAKKTAPADNSTHAQLEASLASESKEQGREAFRLLLLAAYDGRCAITDCDVEAALEGVELSVGAAERADAASGLLLRADLGRLFEMGLLAVDVRTMTVALSSRLRGTAYEGLSGAAVRMPVDGASWPNAGLLERHREFRFSA